LIRSTRMDKSIPQRSRPGAVTVAVVLLCISVVAGLIKAFGRAKLDNPFTYVLLAVIVGVQALIIWLIFRGKNWARWVFIVVFALGLLVSPWSIQRLLTHSRLDLVLYCIQLTLQLGAAVALCLGPARQWFGGGAPAA
jgi:hypothetical protein